MIAEAFLSVILCRDSTSDHVREAKATEHNFPSEYLYDNIASPEETL